MWASFPASEVCYPPALSTRQLRLTRPPHETTQRNRWRAFVGTPDRWRAFLGPPDRWRDFVETRMAARFRGALGRREMALPFVSSSAVHPPGYAPSRQRTLPAEQLAG